MIFKQIHYQRSLIPVPHRIRLLAAALGRRVTVNKPAHTRAAQGRRLTGNHTLDIYGIRINHPLPLTGNAGGLR